MRKIFIYTVIFYLAMITPSCNILPKSTWNLLPTPSQMEKKKIDAVCANRNLVTHLDQWCREAARRYNDFILILVHGDVVGGVWIARSDNGLHTAAISDIVKEMRSRFGEDRRVVLIVCNTKGITPKISNVSYSLKLVWATPDSYISGVRNMVRDFPVDSVGDIFEFEEIE